VDALNIKENGIYVDATFGGGGHSKAILERLNKGKLIAFDQDIDATKNIIYDKRFTLIRQNFKYMLNFLRYHKCLPVQGILADLGISSHQINEASRGFSTRYESRLDMRMDKDVSLTAAEVLNTYPEKKLEKIFSEYGELNNSKAIAHTVASLRMKKKIENVNELKGVLKSCVPALKENQFFAKVFQALRIEVNDELNSLKKFLQHCSEALERGGRLTVISYHSLEDRIVKDFMRSGNFEGIIEKDFYGKPFPVPFRELNRKPIMATEVEINRNPRARSAKMRIAERN
jgi:16S rRNA (cytosine1402-N4)-methyltransferase